MSFEDNKDFEWDMTVRLPVSGDQSKQKIKFQPLFSVCVFFLEARAHPARKHKQNSSELESFVNIQQE